MVATTALQARVLERLAQQNSGRNAFGSASRLPPKRQSSSPRSGQPGPKTSPEASVEPLAGLESEEEDADLDVIVDGLDSDDSENENASNELDELDIDRSCSEPTGSSRKSRASSSERSSCADADDDEDNEKFNIDFGGSSSSSSSSVHGRGHQRLQGQRHNDGVRIDIAPAIPPQRPAADALTSSAHTVAAAAATPAVSAVGTLQARVLARLAQGARGCSKTTCEAAPISRHLAEGASASAERVRKDPSANDYISGRPFFCGKRELARCVRRRRRSLRIFFAVLFALQLFTMWMVMSVMVGPEAPGAEYQHTIKELPKDAWLATGLDSPPSEMTQGMTAPPASATTAL